MNLLKNFLGFAMTKEQGQNTTGGTTKVDPAWRKKEREAERAAKTEARKAERASKKAEKEAAREERGSGYDC